MTTSPTSEWPTDPDKLARIAADAERPSVDRERACRELLSVICLIARRVAARFSAQYRDDLFRTCYFITVVRSAPRERRWRLLVKQLLERYAKRNGDGTFSPPDPSAWPLKNEKTGEWINNPRFRTEACWGIDPPLPAPWDRLPPYGPPPAPAGPATTLDPRHRY
jgi:hypothetical protein